MFERNATTAAGPFQRAQAMAGFDAGLRQYMLYIYNYMASALALTGIVAYFAANNAAMQSLLYSVNAQGQMGPSLLGFIVMLAPLGMALLLGFKAQSMSLQSVQVTYWAFATVMGLSLSSIFMVYTGESIARTFFITAGTFGAMSLYGYTTRKDLTSIGSFLIMGVFGLIIASLVNLFLQSSGLAFAISALGVLIFTGLIAYDTQKLKEIYYQFQGAGDGLKKVAVMGALNLYMDFINLFLQLLRFVGDRRQ